jgi:hypothetical protein
MRPVGERTGMCVRRPAGTEHGPGGQEARKATLRGGLLFGYFLLATQEKVTRAKRESLCRAGGTMHPEGCWLLMFVTRNEGRKSKAAEHAPL